MSKPNDNLVVFRRAEADGGFPEHQPVKAEDLDVDDPEEAQKIADFRNAPVPDDDETDTRVSARVNAP